MPRHAPSGAKRRCWGARLALKDERDALLCSRLADAAVYRAGSLDATELRRHVFGAVHPFVGQVGIERERMPAHAHFVGVESCEGTLKAPLADVAPGTDGVGDDDDLDHDGV